MYLKSTNNNDRHANNSMKCNDFAHIVLFYTLFSSFSQQSVRDTQAGVCFSPFILPYSIYWSSWHDYCCDGCNPSKYIYICTLFSLKWISSLCFGQAILQILKQRSTRGKKSSSQKVPFKVLLICFWFCSVDLCCVE